MSENLTATPISGNIYQLTNAAENENRFPITVIEAVLGLSSYLQQQFSTLSTLYMGINDVALSGTTLTVKGTSVNLATVTDLSNYYTKTETDGRYLQLTGGEINGNIINPFRVNSNSESGHIYIPLYSSNVVKAEFGYWNGSGVYMQNPVGYHTLAITDNGVLNYDSYPVLHSGNYSSYALPLSGGTMANTNVVTNLNADLLDGQHASSIIDTASTNPKSELKTGQEFVFRKTNVEWDAKSGVIKKIKGKTLAWNQLYNPNKETTSIRGLICTWVNDHYHISGTITADYADLGILIGGTMLSETIAGHKYLFAGIRNSDPNVTIRPLVGADADFNVPPIAVNNGPYIAQLSDALYSEHLYAPIGTEVDLDYYPQLTDLTLAGIADEIITPADFLALYPGYHEQNPGTLISNDAEAVETTGVNQWDEEWVNGYYYAGTLYSDSTVVSSKNKIPVIPGETYNVYAPNSTHSTIEYYDENGNDIKIWQLSSSTFTIPSGVALINFSIQYPADKIYENDICINLSNPAINGQYFPYWKRRINLGLKNIKVVSPNVWDEEWESGYLGYGAGNAGQPIPNASTIRTKNYIPVIAGQTYYFLYPEVLSHYYWLYDANFNCIVNDADISGSGEIVVPGNAAFMKFACEPSYGTTYNNDITINISNPAFNGRYFPYGTLELEGGLKGAGSVYDEIRDGKYIKRIGEVDLGTLSWYGGSYGNFHRFGCGFTLGKQGESTTIAANAITPKYIADKYVTDADAWASDKTFNLVYDSIFVLDNAYSDTGVFASAMQGVMLYYELLYEEVYDLAEPLPSVYPCDQFGTERVISPVSVTPSAPFVADIQYGAKSDDVANDLIGTRDAVQPLLDALQYDGQNHAWHLKGNLYADGFVTAGGINSGATPIVIAPVVYEVDNWTGTVGKTDGTTWSQIAAKYGQGYNVQIDNTDGALYSVIGDDGDGTLYLSGGCTLIVDTE